VVVTYTAYMLVRDLIKVLVSPPGDFHDTITEAWEARNR
jgi:hypothetical protein